MVHGNAEKIRARPPYRQKLENAHRPVDAECAVAEWPDRIRRRAGQI
jgi:hypothetical protein